MKRLKIVCLVILIASAIACIVVLVNSREPKTFNDVLTEIYGEEESQEVYAKIQHEIATYITQYGFLTDSWVIENITEITDDGISLLAKLDDGTVLTVTYNNTTHACFVETQ